MLNILLFNNNSFQPVGPILSSQWIWFDGELQSKNPEKTHPCKFLRS